MNSAIPIAIGTAISIAISEMTTVTQSRSSTPKPQRRAFDAPLPGEQEVDLVVGDRRHRAATRKIATSTISMTMNSPDPDARAANTRSPIRPRPRPPETDPAPKTGASPSSVPMPDGSAEPIGNAESSPRSAQSIDSPPIDGGGSGSAMRPGLPSGGRAASPPARRPSRDASPSPDPPSV